MARNRDDNLDYWRKREEEARQNTIKDEAEYGKRLDGIYNSMQVNIEKEINGFYSRYATKNGISMAEAKKRVQNADMEALSRKAEKYVREKDFSDKANEEMALYNLAMKTNRLELLKAQIELELIDGFNDVEHEMERDLLKTSMKEYERMAGILGKSVKDAEKHAHELVNTSFRNAHFSDRVWYSEWSLKVELERLLRIGLIQGRNPNVLMRDVEKALKVSKYEARRVMVTEMCRVQTGAQKQTYERNGYDQYTFIVEHDDRLCDDCRDLDGQIFNVKDMAPGHNAPPIHCFCRCSTSAYADRARLDALIAQIEAERKDGKAGGEDSADRYRFTEPNKNIVAFEKKYRDAKTEHAIITAPDGSVFSTSTTRKHRAVQINEPYEVGYTISHNHPAPVNFSTQDVKNFERGGYKQIRAATSEGVYILEAENPKFVDVKNGDNFFGAMQRHWNELDEESSRRRKELNAKAMAIEDKRERSAFAGKGSNDILEWRKAAEDEWLKKNAPDFGYHYKFETYKDRKKGH
jgi:SPP1 gp7 family putative phage head morphogenesis protein